MKIHISEAPETDDVGIADNDIDGFLKNILASVNRECSQNSNDEAEERPVKMSFDQIDVPTSEIPDVEVFRDIVNRCHQDSVSTKSKKGQEFFSNARKVLSQDHIKVLLVSDEGTKGAGGEFSKGGKFYTLVVSKGRTDKDNVYSAGSFGIGKNAAIAGSELRLVFYASNYSETGDFYCMGKSVLTSWSNDDGQNMSHKIFFGGDGEKLLPSSSNSGLPEWLNKEDRGLRLAIVAPRIELKEGWSHGYIACLLSNFFVAIHDGDLQFTLDGGKVVLNKNTILGYFSDSEVITAAESSGDLERLRLAHACVEAFSQNEFTSEALTIRNLGEFEVLIRVAEGLPKKVCFIRNGMYITDTLNHFGRPLLRFQNTRDFIVIVRPIKIDDTSSETIKRMENPEHSELTTSYIADENEVAVLKSSMKNLETGVRKIIKKHAKMEVTASRVIEELREFFPESGEDEEAKNNANEPDPTAVTTDLGKEKGFRDTRVQQSGGNKGGKGKRKGKKTRKRGKKGPGTGKGDKKDIAIHCHSVKTANSSDWQVKFSTLPESGILELWPEEESRSGTDSRPIMINSCSAPGASISKGSVNVQISLTCSTPKSFTVTLSRDVSVIDMRPVLKEVQN